MSILGSTVRLVGRGAVFVLKNLPIPLSALLLAQIGILYVAVSDVEIPEFLLSHFFESLEKNEGLRCSAGEIRLRNLTVVEAKDFRVTTTNGNGPSLTIRRCAIKLAPSALIDGNPIPRFVCADGVKLICPPALSATGKAENLVSDGLLWARRDGGKIEIFSARCRVADIEIVAFGKIPGTREFFVSSEKNAAPAEPPPAEASPETSVATNENVATKLSEATRTLSEILNRKEFRALPDGASVAVEFREDDARAHASVLALVPSVELPSSRVRFEKITARQDFSGTFSAREIVPEGRARAFAETAIFDGGAEFFSDPTFVRADGIFVSARIPDDAFSPSDAPVAARLPERIFLDAKKIRAASLAHGDFSAEDFRAEISPTFSENFPDALRFSANVFSGTRRVAATGILRNENDGLSLNFNYNFSSDKNGIFSVPQLRFLAKQDDLKNLRVDGLVRSRGNVRFAPGLKFEKADVEIFSDATECGNVKLRALRAAGTVSPTAISFREIRADGADFVANADVFSELSDSGDFRVRAWGSIDPRCIDGRLGWFWERIWRDLAALPAERAPRADIDVYGNWAENWEYVFGAIAGENCWANGIVVDQVRLRVFEKPELIAAFDMGFVLGDDLVRGNLQWHYAMEPIYHYRDFRFLFDGKSAPKTVLQIVGEGLPEALSMLETDGAGTAHVSGMFSGDVRFYPDRMLVNVSGEVPGGVSFLGIEGEDFRGEIFYDNGVVLVGNPFTVKTGDGAVSGGIRVTLPEDGHGAAGSKVSLGLTLADVRRSAFEKALAAIGTIAQEAENDAPAEVVAENSSEKTSEKSDEKTDAPKEDRSRVRGKFSGALTLPDLQTLDGVGTLFLQEDDLFELQFFGGFSSLLSTLGIDLTTFALDRAEGSFTVRDGKIFIPDLRVYGESGELNIQADIAIPSLEIVGEASFRNLRGTKIPLIGKIIELGWSPTSVLPVEIKGTPENLEWSLSPTFSRIWTTPPAKYGIAPEKKSDAATENSSEIFPEKNADAN